MKSCIKCGAKLSDEALICRECGEAQSVKSVKSSGDDMFSMPYLSANTSADSGKSRASEKVQKTEEKHKEEKSISSGDEQTQENAQIIDPLERAFAKRDRRNKLIRLTALVIAVVIILSTGLYFFTRKSGYYRTLDSYIDGMTSSGGSKYISIVPEIYLLKAESLYKMSRPEIKSTTNNYLEYVENQYANDYGSGLLFSYKIKSERSVTDKESIESLEASIKSVYSTDIDISEAAYVTIKLTTEGSLKKHTENDTITFYKYDGSWYCMEAMEKIKFACENAGYQLW
ncbi:MAG: hypothetical protein ACI4JD_09005 [Ruminococcus sp.]